MSASVLTAIASFQKIFFGEDDITFRRIIEIILFQFTLRRHQVKGTGYSEFTDCIALVIH
jgi:hypothetical protein